MFKRLDALDWQLRAACRGPQGTIFFPPSTPESRAQRRNRERVAKAICETCSVRQDCLDYALTDHEQHGIWGGLSERERQRLALAEDCCEEEVAVH